MDICHFHNSSDIAEYWRHLQYPVTSTGLAWLIWQCHSATMSERHAAWQELINKWPDSKVEDTLKCYGWNSLHLMLQEYMALEEKLHSFLEEKDEKAIYIFDEYGPILNGEKNDWYGGYICKDISGTQLYAIEHQGKLPYRIRKRWFGEVKSITGYYDRNGNLLRIEQHLLENKLADRERELWWKTFPEMYFDFPIPFKKGDLVQNVHTKEPFVLLDTTPWRRSRSADSDGLRKPKHPSKDMYAFGYSYDAHDHFLWDDYITDYMDLEYCTEPLTGHRRILEAYSRFEKGEIDAWTLLKLFRMYECEAIAAKNYRQLKSFGAVK